MTRQIALGYGAPSPADLENRIHALEVKLINLTEAVTLLAGALEQNGRSGGADDRPDDEPDDQADDGPDDQADDQADDQGDRAAADTVAEAARQAHELLRTSHHHLETTEPARSNGD